LTSQHSDIAIIGTGPAGLVTALSVAAKGFNVALVGRRPIADPARPDTRTIALFEPSIELLKNIDAWEACSADGTALRGIRIIDDTGGLIRGPEILFDASDIEREAFGYNIPNEHLISALFFCTQKLDNITFIETQGVVRVEPGKDQVEITLKEGETHITKLLAAADGRNSICREAAGIEVKRWSYPQIAVVCNFEHTGSHDNISTEFHRKAGPFTTVPMADTGNRASAYMSSLVWVETPDEANRIKALNEAGYILEMEKRLQGLLGDVKSIGPRASFPLSGMTAKLYAKNRVALVGETAHVVPPIGAQGLNLSFRDAAHLADCTQSVFCDENSDPGVQSVLDAYHDARRSDVEGRAWGIDLLNRALISKHYPMQFARGLGLHAISAMPAIKKQLMREGMKAGDSLPSLMRASG